MLLLEVLEDMVAHLHQWGPHGVSQAHLWIVLLAGLVTATDLRLHAAGQEMGRGILDLVGHLLDMKAGFLITTSGGIGLTTLMKILGIVASLTGRHHQNGDHETMGEMAFWTGKGMRGDHYLRLHLLRHRLVADGLIVI